MSWRACLGGRLPHNWLFVPWDVEHHEFSLHTQDSWYAPRRKNPTDSVHFLLRHTRPTRRLLLQNTSCFLKCTEPLTNGFVRRRVRFYEPNNTLSLLLRSRHHFKFRDVISRSTPCSAANSWYKHSQLVWVKLFELLFSEKSTKFCYLL